MTPSNVTRCHAMPFGAEVRRDGAIRFALWAPAQEAVAVALEDGQDLAMAARGDGWHFLVTRSASAGSLYRFRLADGSLVADPASRHQPQDAGGPSEVIDPRAFFWSDGDWRGRPWEEAVLYEAHLGAVTAEGTFRALMGRLDHLCDLGVTALEIMPVADFPGRWNWGYDGVLPFAPDAAYGRPEDFKALIEAAHAKGLMVLLDVVYNHFGPQDNYLHRTAPGFFTSRHATPWGPALDFEGTDAVRSFVIHNALYWVEEFHLDGLRLDAVHAIFDDGRPHILEELADRVTGLIGGRRQVHLVLENDANQARWLERRGDGVPRWYRAQWNDDLHHCLHAIVTGDSAGYYRDYSGDVARLGRALAEGFAYQGEASAFRDGLPRGEPSRHLPASAFVAFLQNHDQIGNRPFGDRLCTLAPEAAVRAALSIVLLGPSVPLLFMGEEWAAVQPFPYFCDFTPELTEQVRLGRSREMAPESGKMSPPDPGAETTFVGAKLNWRDATRPAHAGWLAWVRHLLALRHAEIVPRLAGMPGGTGRFRVVSRRVVTVWWVLGEGSRLSLLANLSDDVAPGLEPAPGRRLWCHGAADRDRLAPWTVLWSLSR